MFSCIVAMNVFNVDPVQRLQIIEPVLQLVHVLCAR